MPYMSPARAIPREGRPLEARRLPQLGILGSARPRVRGSGRETPDRRPGAGGSWRQPHRARIHGRPERRIPVSGSVPRRLCESTDLGFERRWTGPSGLLHRRRGTVRSATEQADANRVRPMPAVLGARGGALAEPSCGRRPRGRGDAGLPAHMARDGSRRSHTRAEVSPRGDVAPAADYVDRIVPSEPEEHADRPSHRIDVGSSVRIGADDPSDTPWWIHQRWHPEITLFKVNMHSLDWRSKKALHPRWLPNP